MITFENVTKSYPMGKSRKIVINDLSIKLPKGVDIGILGRNGAGKSTLFRLISGSEPPDKGAIRRDGTVSWPLGFSGGFHGSLTARENVRFVCRIYGRDPKKVFDFVEDFSELGRYVDMPVKSYSSGMRARLAFGLSMAIHFDYYLIDEVIAVGDTRFKKKCQKILRERRQESTMILVSHSNSLLKDFCKAGAVVDNGLVSFFDSIDDAIQLHESNQLAKR
ncbi:ABC transporter ATP-binding protein [Ochrobactrum sp. SD129]|nr:ABC transporter ATP-binding protein [Ochrobactrum sp. SD129]